MKLPKAAYDTGAGASDMKANKQTISLLEFSWLKARQLEQQDKAKFF